MFYIVDKNKLKTLREISEEYKIPLKLLQGRYYRGIRDINILTLPAYEMVRK